MDPDRAKGLMGKDNQAVYIQIDDSKSTSDIVNPKFPINVLRLLKSAQMQHGLRHVDHARYQRYCTARLRRLHKSLKFTHGRGKYTRRPINESTITEMRKSLESCHGEKTGSRWSKFMSTDLPDWKAEEGKWATLFSQLCAIKGDSRTSLEAEAYASYMKGISLFEQDQNWNIALQPFKISRAVYEELGKYGDLENQVLCCEHVEELELSIRYCRHKIGVSNALTPELLHMEGPAMDLFRAKLEAVMAEARSQQATSTTEFHWLGHSFPISNMKTMVSISKGQ